MKPFDVIWRPYATFMHVAAIIRGHGDCQWRRGHEYKCDLCNGEAWLIYTCAASTINICRCCDSAMSRVTSTYHIGDKIAVTAINDLKENIAAWRVAAIRTFAYMLPLSPRKLHRDNCTICMHTYGYKYRQSHKHHAFVCEKCFSEARKLIQLAANKYALCLYILPVFEVNLLISQLLLHKYNITHML